MPDSLLNTLYFEWKDNIKKLIGTCEKKSKKMFKFIAMRSHNVKKYYLIHIFY